MVRIIMIVDGGEYLYGTYPFKTDEEKERVVGISLDIQRERGICTYIQEV